ncbi:hypothetical protein EWM64_g5129 [Hericium alpestre]|uniref:Uncharacterized protein n=1 Tax=Hericium alpestre TaxID=135208 RepID=A0A4Y9ZXF7_9AGAM|nr:hypothetical protein EWM64_g5129 [Hericium alpestre]
MASASSFSHDPDVSYDNYNVGGYPNNVQAMCIQIHDLYITITKKLALLRALIPRAAHTDTLRRFSSYAGPANAGPYQDVYTSNSVAEAATSSRHSFPAHSSSHHQTYSVVETHAATSSSRVSRSSSTHTSNKQLAASSSRRQSEKEEIKAKMRPMQTRMRLPPVNPALAESMPLPSSTAEKRKDRSPSPSAPEGSQPEPKKTKSSSKAAIKAAVGRVKRNSDLAELASRLPPALYLPEDVPTAKNVRQAIIHIDQQKAQIERLQSEVNRLHAEAAYQRNVHHAEVQQAQSQIAELLMEASNYQLQINQLTAERNASSRAEAPDAERRRYNPYNM